MHEVVAWPCMGELTGNMGRLRRTLGRGIGSVDREGKHPMISFFFIGTLLTWQWQRGNIPNFTGIISSITCCMSSGWLHHQFETNSKDSTTIGRGGPRENILWGYKV
jgi:hypothetical protein